MRLGLVLALVACSQTPADPPSAPACDDLPTAEGCVRVGCVDCDLRAPSCEPGKMALPGETTCHAVSACAEVTGSIRVNAGERISDAIAAAPAGAVIAIAPGNYTEALRIGKPLTLVGACAERVTITGLRPDWAAIDIRARVTLRGLSVTGPDQGILIRDGDAELDAVRVHGTQNIAVLVDILNTKVGRVSIKGSLIEAVNIAGVAAFGAEATIEKTVIRDTRMRSGAGGPGVMSQHFKGVAPRVVVRGSLVEKNHEVSVGVAGGSLEVIDSLIRDTQPMANGAVGNGILAAIDKTTGAPSTLRVVSSVVERSHEIAIALGAGEATIEKTVIRDVLPRPRDNVYGMGIQADYGTRLTVRGTTIERANQMGIGVFGAHATIEDTLIAGCASAGIGILDAEGTTSVATIARVMVHDNTLAGIFVAGSELTLSESAVRRTRTKSEKFGDGIVAIGAAGKKPTLSVRGATFEGNARAGVAMFDGTLELAGSRLSCNAFDLDIEEYLASVQLVDGGGNTCGCKALAACRAQKNTLESSPVPSRAGR